jgi:hypothetical protein
MATCILADIDRRFRGAYCFPIQGDRMMEARSPSETSVNIYQTVPRNFSGDKILWVVTEYVK